MSADEHLGPQFNVRVGEKFADRRYPTVRNPEPDNPAHHEKYIVAHVHASGAATVKPYPIPDRPTTKRVPAEELQARAIPWGKRMDPRKLGYTTWQPGQD